MLSHAPRGATGWRPERIGRIAQPAILLDPANRFRFGEECRHCSRRQSGSQFFHRKAAISTMGHAKGSVWHCPSWQTDQAIARIVSQLQ